MATGLSESEAQRDICLAVAEQKIEIKYKTDEFVGPDGGTQWQPFVGIAVVPDNLRPRDIDWEASSSRRVWEDGQLLGGGFGYIVTHIKVRTADVIRTLCFSNTRQTMPVTSPIISKVGIEKAAPESTSPLPSRTPRKSSPALELAKRAISELYPDGVPQQTDEPNATLCQSVFKRLKATGQREVSDDTILRAAGRRR